MRRADRLFQLVQILRNSRVITATTLAARLGVSKRTVYRDIADLSLSGIPVEGEAGVGYRLPQGFELPPLMFTAEELEAMLFGARIVESWADTGLAQAAKSALTKIEAVVPERLKAGLSESVLFSLNFSQSSQVTGDLAILRQAIREQHKVHFDYVRADGTASSRTVRPLCLAFIAPVWLLASWCELRHEFRNFRLDRIARLDVLPEIFVDEPGRNLEDFLLYEAAQHA